MMHEREKSDTAGVAVTPTNKAGASIAAAAESVEPRAGTKRNAGEQSTHRTLSRARSTQALDRVRQAARQRKKEKFTALLHHLSIDLLWEAFLALMCLVLERDRAKSCIVPVKIVSTGDAGTLQAQQTSRTRSPRSTSTWPGISVRSWQLFEPPSQPTRRRKGRQT